MSAAKHIDVLVYGLGAIGSFYAFILSRAPTVRLTVVARSNFSAVKERGIVLNSESHGRHIIAPSKVLRTVAEAGQRFDLIVCANKALDQDASAAQIAPAVDEKRTTIAIIQNGVGNEEPFRKRFPRTTIISCVTWTAATQPEPGQFEQIKSEDLQIGLYPNKYLDSGSEQEKLDRFSALLRQGNTVFNVVPDIQVLRWEKVVWNVAWNSLTTLTQLDTHAWLSSSPGAKLMTHKLMTEVIDVAIACNVPLDHELADRLIDRILSIGPISSSMAMDCQAGREMEVDIILGYPLRKARELGVATPMLEALHTILVAVNHRLKKH
ncbi:Oxidoreductase AFT12-1 like protein [Verticillium longisporum]|nr:Oxidoreductase AFT12-1 like protein [Verticillium longisporum]